MQRLFTTSTPFEPERVHAVAVYCSDGRYGDHNDEFLHEHLGLPNYDRVAVAGGPAWLSFRGHASLTQYGVIRDQLDFLVKAHKLNRVVLIAHYGCAYYLSKQPGDADSNVPIQLQDLRDAANTIRGWYPSLTVEIFLARAHEGRVSFEAVPDT